MNHNRKYTFAPVAIFAFNRPDHLSKTINALKKNNMASSTDVIIYCDGPKTEMDLDNVNAIHKIADTTNGFNSVIVKKKQKNAGLASSIINGVTEIVEEFGKVIVVEDDIVMAPNALKYFNDMLTKYELHQEIFSISGFSFPETKMQFPENYDYDVYAIPRMQCWGWATWKDKWNKADFSMSGYDDFNASEILKQSYGYRIGFDSLNTLNACVKNNKDVWACRWVYTHFINNALCLCPVKSLVENIGLDGSGQNCGVQDMNNEFISNTQTEWRCPPFGFIDHDIHKSFMSCFGQDIKNQKEKNIKNKKEKNIKNQKEKSSNTLSWFKTLIEGIIKK